MPPAVIRDLSTPRICRALDEVSSTHQPMPDPRSDKTPYSVEQIVGIRLISARCWIQDPEQAVVQVNATVLAILPVRIACVDKNVELVPALAPSDRARASAGRVVGVDVEGGDDLALFRVSARWVVERVSEGCVHRLWLG